jgi:hypothetical protein
VVIWGVGWGEGEGWSHTNHLARFSGSSSEKGRGGVPRGGYPLHPLARVAKVWMSVEDWGGGVLTGGGRGVSPGHIETNYQKCRRNCYFARSFRHPLKMVE